MPDVYDPSPPLTVHQVGYSFSRTSWTGQPHATFDLETTRIDVKTARIVTASLLLVDAEGEVIRAGEWLANSGAEIPAEVAAVHGITTEYAQTHGKPAQEVVYQLATDWIAFAHRIPHEPQK